LCLSIIIDNNWEIFNAVGWVTLILTSGIILLCFRIRRHYRKVGGHLKRLDDILSDIPPVVGWTTVKVLSLVNTAVLMVKEFGGLGIHSFLSIQRLFPNHFKNIMFISVVNVDAITLKGQDELDELTSEQRKQLEKYVNLANQLGFGSTYRLGAGTDVIDEMEKLSAQIAKEFSHSILFAGKMVSEREKWYQRILHYETAYAIQRRIHFGAMNVWSCRCVSLHHPRHTDFIPFLMNRSEFLRAPVGR
jgi:hypothetical protein